MSILKIHTDGGSKGNPGPAAIGVVMHLDDELVFTYREDIGIGTNNTAEYAARRCALPFAQKAEEVQESITAIMCIARSELMVKQLTGLYKVKHEDMKKYVLQAHQLKEALIAPVSFVHVRREENTIADALVNGEYEIVDKLDLQ